MFELNNFYNIDCMEGMKEFPDNYFELAIVDPPYGIGIDGQKEADFIPVVAWRKTAELCEKYLSKGSQVAISGRIQTRSYDANDGGKRYVTEVVADEVHFIGEKSVPRDPMDGFEEIDDLADVPF